MLILVLVNSCAGEKTAIIPSYLKDYQAEYAANPRTANLNWFKDARFGMFIHYNMATYHGVQAR